MMADPLTPSVGGDVRAAVAIDAHRPNLARIHDALLGGKDSYSVDRPVADKLLANTDFRVAIHQSRVFMLRAVAHLVGDHGITQVVELGCGYPAWPAVHEVASGQNPTAKTLYIDSDPAVAAHGRAMLVGPNAVFAEADLTDTTVIVEHIGAVMDTAAPIAICMSGTAEVLTDAPAVLESLFGRLPAGTWLVFTHLAADTSDYEIDWAVGTLLSAGIGYRPRSRDEVEAMLAPFLLLDPGVVAPDRWRPDPIVGEDDGPALLWPMPTVCAYAAVGQLRRR